MEQVYIKALLDVLDTYPGPKNLIIDYNLVNFVNLILQIQTLQEHKVVHVGSLRPHTRQPILTFFLIKNNSIDNCLEMLDKSAQNIVLVTPRINLQTQLKLEQTDLLYQAIPLIWSLIENDVYSLELPCFKDLYVFNDPSILNDLSHGLMQLKECHGPINNIVSKGKYAVESQDLFLKMMDIDAILKNRKQPQSPSNASSIPSNQFFPTSPFENPELEQQHVKLDLFIFDRSIDFTTPLLKQLTYNGLLSEYCNIDCGHIDENIPMMDPNKPTTSKKIKLKDDAIYNEIKDLNFAAVGTTINKLAKSLKQDYDSRNQANTVVQIKAFVSKLGTLQNEHKSLRFHTNIAEQLQKVMDDDFHKIIEIQQSCASGNESLQYLDFVEELINRNEHVDDLIRLYCFLSLINDGIRTKTFDYLKKEIVSSFGLPYYEIIDHLYAAKLLIKKDDGLKSTFKQLKKGFNLYVQTNEKDPTDLAYVYSGIAPLIPRLMQTIVSNGIEASMETIAKVPGPQNTKIGIPTIMATETIVVVMYIGGITQAEISALRFIFKEKQTKLLILTTNICTKDFYKR